MIEVDSLDYRIKNIDILKSVSIRARKGQTIGILGPNGSGKSSLLKNIYNVLSPSSGVIYIEGENLLKLKNREIAEKMAVVSQENAIGFEFSVREIVEMSRYHKKTGLESIDQRDQEIVEKNLTYVGMEGYIDRNFSSLSGGEKQRVLIARALAQDTDYIILDEPTNHLDIGSQIKTLKLLRETGKTMITALHDLSLAGRFCDYIYVLHKGEVYREGKPKEVITKELVKELYDLDCEIFFKDDNIFIHYL